VFIRQVTAAKSLDDYVKDRLMRQAVERNFEIIGEAVGRIAKDDSDVAAKIGGCRQIIAFRNILIHGYHVIDSALVWKVIQDDLPILEEQVTALLDEFDET